MRLLQLLKLRWQVGKKVYAGCRMISKRSNCIRHNKRNSDCAYSVAYTSLQPTHCKQYKTKFHNKTHKTDKTYENFMISREIEIINKLGLHARASAKLTQLASKFQSEIWMSRNQKRVNAKSIMGVMMLAAGKGTTVVLETEGVDEQQAMDALAELIAARFGESE